MWAFDPRAYEAGQVPNGTGFVHRGVAAWRDSGTLRIFINSRDRLICLDGKTGALVPSFGTGGVISLVAGLKWQVDPKQYTNTSPPVVFKNIVIVGNGVADRLVYPKDPPGDVRAFDARTGRPLWTFHTVPQAGEFGVDTWDDESWRVTGHTNVWAPMTLDERRGLVYLPVSTPSNDFYGGARPGQNLFAESIVCLDAATGVRKWHFQTVHHGIWDYDLPSPPNLVSIRPDGRAVDAVVQLTKQGLVFVFDRLTGKPVWPIEERPVPPSDVPGERAWPTQPFPTKPPPIAELAGLIVQVTGRRFAIPFECPCCGAPPDTELRVPRARGVTAAPDSAAGLDVPYCSRCMRHAEAWEHAGVGSAAVLVVGVLAFIGLSLVAARPLLGLIALVASIPVALAVAAARRKRAKAGCTEACAAPGMALAYHGFNGTLTSIAFESLTYAARFAEHNTGIVLETPQLRRLLEGHRIARLQVPTPPPPRSRCPPRPRRPSGAARSSGPRSVAGRTALSRALDALPDEAVRANLIRSAADAELAPVLAHGVALGNREAPAPRGRDRRGARR